MKSVAKQKKKEERWKEAKKEARKEGKQKETMNGTSACDKGLDGIGEHCRLY